MTLRRWAEIPELTELQIMIIHTKKKGEETQT